MHLIQTLLLRLMLALSLVLPAQAQAQGAGEEAAIREMIGGQFEAFKADDVEGAFAYAAPVIQKIFRTPENFGMMVRNGYPMVWRPADVRFLDLHPREGGIWQKVMVTDAKGAVHVLDYEVVATPEGLRIGGVDLLKLPDVGA